MNEKKLAAIILAAGMSRRMGKPKMLLTWGKTTVLGQVVSTLAAAITGTGMDWGDRNRVRERMAPQNRTTDEAERQIALQPRAANGEMIVVTGGAREAVEAEVTRLAESFPARAIFNEQYEEGGMMSSIRAGLAGLRPGVAAALIALGDQPQLSLDSARKIVSAWETSGARLIIPSHALRRGHPWLVRHDLWQELGEANSAREFLNSRADEILYVNCDESVLKDLDTPEDYQRDLKNAA